MWFATNRLIFWAVLFFVAFLIIRKSKTVQKRRLIIIALIGALLLGTLSQFLIIENIFTFTSPQSAFSYISSEEIRFLVEGKETTMIISSNQDLENYTIIPKTERGWKLSIGIDQRKIFRKTVNLHQISVLNCKNTSDYYVSVVDVSETARQNPLSISDSKGSSFQEFIKNPNSRSVTYMAYINDYDGSLTGEYYLLINGEKVAISN